MSFSVLFVGKGTITEALASGLRRKDATVGFLRRSFIITDTCLLEFNDLDEAFRFNNWDYVVSCVPDDVASRDFWSKSCLKYLKQHGERHPVVAIELSTISASATEKWSQQMESHGVKHIVAPFTGSREGAEGHTLSIYAHSNSVEIGNDVFLNTISSRIFSFSTPKGPATFKLIKNAWGILILATLADILPVIRSENLTDKFSEIVPQDPGMWMHAVCKDKFEQCVEEQFNDVHFSFRLMKKDYEYFIDAFGDHAGSIANQVWHKIKRLDQPENRELDFSVLSRPDQCTSSECKSLANTIVATLGPEGTDCHTEAKKHFENIRVFGSFREAVQFAKTANAHLLLPAAMRETNNERIEDWTAFQFSEGLDVPLVDVWVSNLRPILWAHRNFESIALHPSSTEFLGQQINDYTEVIHTRSKRSAHQMFEDGSVTAAVFSKDERTSLEFETKAVFEPSMVWCLYDFSRRRSSIAS